MVTIFEHLRPAGPDCLAFAPPPTIFPAFGKAHAHIARDVVFAKPLRLYTAMAGSRSLFGLVPVSSQHINKRPP
ncbi:hypothetical protein J2848_000590 [Azospirillum lipoferum]|uniref:Uncharacterized protein n=1 Tax=Azospirillum lipoferum TaxID=193 RepID=A0A5A9GGX0_AZOLI|nr:MULTISPECIES: hypothetical protein [Azospirillum]KAA0593577.1 hypothetical protein FZ942_24385 [Azospirillum lipoferum]MCP1608954.1 hypothetical protein [Azospirillum lipoferum]MDW5535732.1 hypothetical protein [Azospirillum sp. NL1]